MLKTKPLWSNQQWVAITDPTAEDYAALQATYHVPARLITRVRDKKGRARFDYDFASRCGLFIVKVIAPVARISERAKTLPFIALVVDDTLITILDQDAPAVTKEIAAQLDGTDGEGQPSSLIMAVMAMLFEFNEHYFDRINDLSNLREKLERYKKVPSDDQILRLSELAKSMIYLKAAASGNMIAAGQLAVIADASDYPDLLTKRERYWLHNLESEYQAARDLAEVNAEIVQQVADAYASLLDKSLNTTMWIMTIWSLALAIPPIVSGFYGMNVKLPIIGGNWDWPFSLLLAGLPAVVLVWLLQRRRHLSIKHL